MRTPQRNFVVEYKTSRRQAQASPPSIWGNLDLQAVARQIEADGILPEAVRPDPNSTVNDSTPVAAIAAAQESQAEIEDDLRSLAGPILDSGGGISLNGLPRELPAIETPASYGHRPAARDARRSDPSSTRTKRVAIHEWTAAEGCVESSRSRDDEEDLVALEAENRRLTRLVIIKLRQENDKLRSMLRRFGSEQCKDRFE